MSGSEHPDIFQYDNYRLFLHDYIRDNYLAKGKSYRAFSKRCGMSSPNYFQQVLAFQRNISQRTAEKISKSMKFSKDASDYFITLVQIESAKNANDRKALFEQLQKIAARRNEKIVKDDGFHGSWVHQIVWSMAHTQFFEANPLFIQRRFRAGVSREEIDNSINFLREKGYFVREEPDSPYRPKPLKIETNNDLRNLSLQRNHSKFMQMGISRMTDDLAEREFQGLTIAFKKSSWPQLKEKMREFVRQMRDSLGDSDEADAVIRLQMAAFIVAD